MKLYFYRLLRRRKGESQRQKGGRGKGADGWRGECEERAQGEAGQESVKETSITLWPLGFKWRQVAGWGRNLMALTESGGDKLQNTWVLCWLDSVWFLLMLISHISLGSVFLSVQPFFPAPFYFQSALRQKKGKRNNIQSKSNHIQTVASQRKRER